MALYLSRGDKRKYDISNYIKALEDCFTHAGVWLDDEQVDQLGVYRLPVEKPGTVRVTIEELLS
jgi:crossover junction endodeoxyribonuclease RusA